MASIGGENDETEPEEDEFNVDCGGDTERLEFDSQFPAFSDEENGNNFHRLQQYLENDTVVVSDAFETQRMEFDSEEQLLNAAEKTQVINLAEETQLLCKEGDFSGALETQLCEFDEEEAVGLQGIDVEGAVETKVLADSDSSTRSSDKPLVRSQEESIHSADVNVSCSSGKCLYCSSSQANALDFIERFVISSHSVLDLDTKQPDVACRKPNPELSAKGIQKLARRVNIGCNLAETGVYDWVDSHEDEGGGEFLTRNKEVFFSKSSGAQKSRTEPRMKGRTHQKCTSEEHQLINVHEKVTGFAQSEVFETLDVGVDTQMAAEAIEALSNGVTFIKDGENSFQGEANSVVKQNLKRKRAQPSDSGIKSHSKQARRKKLKKVVKGKATSRVQNSEKVISTNVNGKPGKRTFKARDKVRKGTRERSLDDNGSIPAKKQCIEKKINTIAPIASRTRKNMLANTASESTGDSTSYAKEKALKLATMRDGKSMVSLQESSRHSEGQPITRQRRSNRRVPSSKHVQPILSSNENNACCSLSAEKAQPECPTPGTLTETEKASFSTCNTPVNCRTSINTALPLCMGDVYYKLPFKKNLERSSLMKELRSLTPSGPQCSLSDKGLRKRRDMASVRILFSHHLDKDIIKHQTKILARLGVPAVSSMLEATHFVADEFARTRNMLEAIAHGKPVVNHLWLESCGQAGCYIDERNYILRDAKKEKELGFSMPVSLARASHHPLLEGKRVLITPSTKPGVEIVSSLVKAVHGQAFERICRSIYKDDKLRDDLLVLSCEEDYEFCMPLLEKGAEIYSSELLLNGIIIQKLELERHRLFLDHVKRTRSTLWLKDGSEFCPVSSLDECDTSDLQRPGNKFVHKHGSSICLDV